MIEKKAIYKCSLCGNLVESLWDGEPDIVCCGQPMDKLTANTVDASKEKHVPVIERNGNKVKVKIGSVPHPMEDKHYILFVEVLAGDKTYRQDFKPGDTVAEAEFDIDAAVPVKAREFCNLHGLWST
jgi:superoxide reductase